MTKKKRGEKIEMPEDEKSRQDTPAGRVTAISASASEGINETRFAEERRRNTGMRGGMASRTDPARK